MIECITNEGNIKTKCKGSLPRLLADLTIINVNVIKVLLKNYPEVIEKDSLLKKIFFEINSTLDEELKESEKK